MQYKVKSPFRYPGGKFYALKYLLPYIEAIPHKDFREVFAGGGSVYFGKKPSFENWINDIDEELINTYKIIKDAKLSNQLIKRIETEIASKERHLNIKEYLPKTKLDRAFKYFYLNRTSYSGIMHKPAWGYKVGKSSPPENWGNMIVCARKKLKKIKITAYDFERVINAKSKNLDKDVLLYLDPPYLVADQKRAYKNSFTMKEHLRLCSLLKKTKYNFVLSYDNSPQIKELYKWANTIELTWNYNTSNIAGGKRKKGKEILITNCSF